MKYLMIITAAILGLSSNANARVVVENWKPCATGIHTEDGSWAEIPAWARAKSLQPYYFGNPRWLATHGLCNEKYHRVVYCSPGWDEGPAKDQNPVCRAWWAQERAIPHLRQGMPYDEAREVVLADGWQANVQSPVQKTDGQMSTQSWFIKRGFSEIDWCYPTGLAVCTAVFHNAIGEHLYLFISGGGDTEVDDPPPPLGSWCLNRRNQNCIKE